MKLTINDIAQLCGVGKSTVSRVLNNDPNVRPATREKVLAVVEQHQFKPSRSARAMRGIEAKVIGIIVTRLDSPSENRALRGILHALSQQGYEHFIVESRFDPALVQAHLHFFSQRQVDGIIVFGFGDLAPEMLLPYRHKLVSIVRAYPQISAVYYDDYGAIWSLLSRLYQQQHRQISYLGVQESDLTTGKMRYQAYVDFCRQHELTPCAALGSLDYHESFRHAAQVVQPETSAVVCATDSLALGVHKYLAERGQSGVQVCGVGNNELLKFLFPHTLSIEFGFFTAGQKAVELLLQRFANPQQCTHFCVESRLAEGESI